MAAGRAGATRPAPPAQAVALAKIDARHAVPQFVQVKLDAIRGATEPRRDAGRRSVRAPRRLATRRPAAAKGATTSHERCGSPRLALVGAGCSSLTAGCSTPSILAPWTWRGSPAAASRRAAARLSPASTASIAQVQVSGRCARIRAAGDADAIYVAATDGTGCGRPGDRRQVWRASAGRTLSAGAGADASIVVVGTDKGDVMAFDTERQALWTAKVSSR